MSDYIEVVENRRGKRRRKMSAKQRKYFGKRRHHKKNPGVLATLAGNPKNRRGRRYHHRTRQHRRHRNPGMIGGLGKLLPFDLRGVLEVGGGIAVSKYGPQLVQKYVWAGMPTSGFGGYAVRLGVTVVLAQALKMVTKSNRTAENIMLGGVGSILYDMFTEYAAPSLGLTGYSDRIRVSDVSSALNGGGIGGYAVSSVKSRLGTLPRQFWG
jgi:hypothetical protein